MTLVERITAAIREAEVGEDRAAYHAEAIRYRTIRATLLDARDELLRAAPIVPKRDVMTLPAKVA